MPGAMWPWMYSRSPPWFSLAACQKWLKPTPNMVATEANGANVATQIAAVCWVEAVGAHHHGHGVPAHIGAQALFNGDVAGAMRLPAPGSMVFT